MSQEVQEQVDVIRSQFCQSYQQSKDLRGLSSHTQLQDSDELTELKKLAQIIRAHATKIGIVCEPSRVYDNFLALAKELQEFANSVFYLLSLLPLFYRDRRDRWASFLLKKLDDKVLELLSGVSVLCNDIDAVLKDETREKKDVDRLRSIGMIWDACDSLHEVGEKGNLRLLGDGVYQSCALVQDVLQDIDAWIADPELGNDFDLEGSDVEEDETGGQGGEEEEALARMTIFIENWKTKIKMIKLLMSSFAKSVSTNYYKSGDTKGSTVQALYDLQKNLVAQVDELMSDFFMADASFDPEELVPTVEALDKLLAEMVKNLKSLNKSDPKKSKWINVWEAKYFQGK